MGVTAQWFKFSLNKFCERFQIREIREIKGLRNLSAIRYTSWYTSIQPTVTDWLKTLDMEEYTQVFHSAGFKTEADVENLKEIDEQELKRMGITKIGMNNL